MFIISSLGTVLPKRQKSKPLRNLFVDQLNNLYLVFQLYVMILKICKKKLFGHFKYFLLYSDFGQSAKTGLHKLNVTLVSDQWVFIKLYYDLTLTVIQIVVFMGKRHQVCLLVMKQSWKEKANEIEHACSRLNYDKSRKNWKCENNPISKRGGLVNNIIRFYTSQAWVESRVLGSSVTAWNQLPSAAYTCVNIEIFGWSHCEPVPSASGSGVAATCLLGWTF